MELVILLPAEEAREDKGEESHLCPGLWMLIVLSGVLKPASFHQRGFGDKRGRPGAGVHSPTVLSFGGDIA